MQNILLVLEYSIPVGIIFLVTLHKLHVIYLIFFVVGVHVGFFIFIGDGTSTLSVSLTDSFTFVNTIIISDTNSLIFSLKMPGFHLF